MPTLKLNLKGTVSSRADASPLLVNPGDAVLVERDTPRWLVLKCPDGCGDELPINLDSRAGKAWRMYKSPRLGLTLYPSIWRDTGCEAHFIIWRSVILLFGDWNDSDYDRFWEDEAYERLRDAVLDHLPIEKMKHFAEIADEIDELPWDVLRACRELVKRNLALEGEKKLRQYFKRKSRNA